jgi:hypothetical protein
MLFLPALWSVRVFGGVINPVALFSLGLATPSFFVAFLNVIAQILEINFPLTIDSEYQSLVAVSLAYSAAILVFLLPWIIGIHKIYRNCCNSKQYCQNSERVYLKRGILVLSILVLLLIGVAGIYMGGIPLIEMLAGSLDVRDSDQSLTILPLGILSFITVGIMIIMLWLVSLFFILIRNRSDWGRYILYLFLLLPVIFWNGKRQNILFFLVVFLFRYILEWNESFHFRKHNLSPWRIIFLSFLILLGTFIFIDAIRYQDAGQGASNSLIFLGYLTWPARNMISIYDHLGYGGIGNTLEEGFFTLAELMPARLGGKDLVLASGDFLFEPTSPSGFLAYWWFDGGFLFSLIGVFVFSSLSFYIYTLRLRSPSWGRIYLLTLWCCITSGVYTHFIALNYYWIPAVFFIIEGSLIGRKRLP